MIQIGSSSQLFETVMHDANFPKNGDLKNQITKKKFIKAQSLLLMSITIDQNLLNSVHKLTTQ